MVIPCLLKQIKITVLLLVLVNYWCYDEITDLGNLISADSATMTPCVKNFTFVYIRVFFLFVFFVVVLDPDLHTLHITLPTHFNIICVFICQQFTYIWLILIDMVCLTYCIFEYVAQLEPNFDDTCTYQFCVWSFTISWEYCLWHCSKIMYNLCRSIL